jgi:hypothetical protein
MKSRTSRAGDVARIVWPGVVSQQRGGDVTTHRWYSDESAADERQKPSWAGQLVPSGLLGRTPDQSSSTDNSSYLGNRCQCRDGFGRAIPPGRQRDDGHPSVSMKNAGAGGRYPRHWPWKGLSVITERRSGDCFIKSRPHRRPQDRTRRRPLSFRGRQASLMVSGFENGEYDEPADVGVGRDRS